MPDEIPSSNHNSLSELALARMPFGKHKGRFLVDLPEPYLVWFQRQGLPPGKLGQQMAAILEIKTNGLEYLLRPFQKSESSPGQVRDKRPRKTRPSRASNGSSAGG
jgi:uncharacterized protein